VASEALGHVLQQLIAGVVAVLVVDRLQAVDVHVRGHQAFAGAAHVVDLALEILESDAAPARAGQLVGGGVLAVALGLLAVRLAELAVGPGEPAVTLRAYAIACGELATLKAAGAQLPQLQRALVDRLVAVLELEHLLVGDVGLAIPARCELVAFLCRFVALTGRLVANVPGLGRSCGLEHAAGLHADLPERRTALIRKRLFRR